MKRAPKAQKNGEPAVRCAYTKLAPTASLKPQPTNPNRHPPAQLALYAKVLLHQGWRKSVTVSNQTGLIVTGHGAWETAKAEGWKTVPVDYQDFKKPADELAHMIADNRLPQLSEVDDEALAKSIEKLGAAQPDFDLDLACLKELGDGEQEIDLPEAPESVQDNLNRMQSIKAQRRKGNANIIAKTDTEFYLVLAFPSRQAKERLLKRLGLPADERYIPHDAVLILPGQKTKRLSNLPKASPANKSGACG